MLIIISKNGVFLSSPVTHSEVNYLVKVTVGEQFKEYILFYHLK